MESLVLVTLNKRGYLTVSCLSSPKQFGPPILQLTYLTVYGDRVRFREKTQIS